MSEIHKHVLANKSQQEAGEDNYKTQRFPHIVATHKNT